MSGHRLPRRLALLGALVAGLLAAGAPAHAAGGPLSVTVTATDPLAPALTLTNTGGTPCQVAATALGTVTFSRVEQGGAVIRPIVSYPAFDERLDSTVTGGLADLGPNSTRRLAVPVLAGGPTGHLVETVSWSAATGPVALLYPVRAGQPLRIDLSYDWQGQATGNPLCGAATAVAARPAATPSPKPTLTGLARHDAWGGWHGAALVLLLLGVLLALLVLGVLLMRSRHSGGVFVLTLLAAGIAAVHPPPARADIRADPSIQAAFDDCLTTFGNHDPAGVLPVLQAPNFTVQLTPATRDSHEGGIPGGAFVFWDPTDRSRLTGPGGNGTGPERLPCATLYHELYHAKEDAQGGRSNFECVTDGGRSGIGTGEVNATRAENALRQALGEPVREVYGGVPLPDGECHPRQAGDRFCTENAAGPMCTCRTDACSESTGDPHLLSYDGRRYDFQAAGEFVASRDAGGGDPGGRFQLQVRQEPYPGRTDVAVNTAVAADVGGDRVEIDMTGGSPRVLVNGEPRDEVGGQLAGGGALSAADTVLGKLIGIAWPDGTAVTVAPIGGFGLSLSTSLAPARAGAVQGLFGNADGDPADDVPAGTLYPGYADSWRVTPATSLFTYPAGRSTASYTDRSFPRQRPAPADTAAAEAICRQAGVTDPAVLANCVLDVAVTGQADFAADAVYGQQSMPSPGVPNPLPATADIYRCGTAPVDGMTGGTGSQPLRARIPAGTGTVTFPEITGTIGATSNATVGPDGDGSFGGTDIPPSYGLSGLRHPSQALFVVGVFLPVPGTPPDTLDGADQADIAPRPGQLFFVGDGRTTAGTPQTVTVPAGATTLCLGFADAYNFKGAPGWFDDNAGAVSITYQLS
jgi:VWD domain-containing protein